MIGKCRTLGSSLLQTGATSAFSRIVDDVKPTLAWNIRFGQALTALSRKPFPVRAPARKAPVQVATTKAPATPKPKAANHHTAAKKPPKSHGQTISPAPIATTASDPSMAEPTSALAPAAHKSRPSTAPEHKSHRGALIAAFAALGVVALLVGAYLTRKRLRGGPTPA